MENPSVTNLNAGSQTARTQNKNTMMSKKNLLTLKNKLFKDKKHHKQKMEEYASRYNYFDYQSSRADWLITAGKIDLINKILKDK